MNAIGQVIEIDGARFHVTEQHLHVSGKTWTYNECAWGWYDDPKHAFIFWDEADAVALALSHDAHVEERRVVRI